MVLFSTKLVIQLHRRIRARASERASPRRRRATVKSPFPASFPWLGSCSSLIGRHPGQSRVDQPPRYPKRGKATQQWARSGTERRNKEGSFNVRRRSDSLSWNSLLEITAFSFSKPLTNNAAGRAVKAPKARAFPPAAARTGGASVSPSCHLPSRRRRVSLERQVSSSRSQLQLSPSLIQLPTRPPHRLFLRQCK